MVPAKILSDLFPKAKFVTLLVSTKTTDILASVLVEKLKRVGSEKKILVVGSVDFAHNLSVIPAMQNNQETIDAISNRNYAKIKDFGDEHLDSPVILEILMKYSYTDNNGEWETWANSHSSLLMDRPNAQGTSYVVGVLRN
jgi:AmmeMemoRadiSam system protein B